MSDASSQLGVSRKIKWDEDNAKFSVEPMDHLNTYSEILDSRADKKKKKSKSKKKNRNKEEYDEVEAKNEKKAKKSKKVTQLKSIEEGSKNIEFDDSVICRQTGAIDSNSFKNKNYRQTDVEDKYAHNPQHNVVAVQSVNPQARLSRLREPGDNNFNISTNHKAAPLKSINPLARATDEETLSSSTPQNKKEKGKAKFGLQAEESVIPNPQHYPTALKPATKSNALVCDDDTIVTNPQHNAVAIKSINPQVNMSSLSAPDSKFDNLEQSTKSKNKSHAKLAATAYSSYAAKKASVASGGDIFSMSQAYNKISRKRIDVEYDNNMVYGKPSNVMHDPAIIGGVSHGQNQLNLFDQPTSSNSASQILNSKDKDMNTVNKEYHRNSSKIMNNDGKYNDSTTENHSSEIQNSHKKEKPNSLKQTGYSKDFKGMAASKSTTEIELNDHRSIQNPKQKPNQVRPDKRESRSRKSISKDKNKGKGSINEMVQAHYQRQKTMNSKNKTSSNNSTKLSKKLHKTMANLDPNSNENLKYMINQGGGNPSHNSSAFQKIQHEDPYQSSNQPQNYNNYPKDQFSKNRQEMNSHKSETSTKPPKENKHIYIDSSRNEDNRNYDPKFRVIRKDPFSCEYCEQIYRANIVNGIKIPMTKCVNCWNAINVQSLEFYMNKYHEELVAKQKQNLESLLESKIGSTKGRSEKSKHIKEEIVKHEDAPNKVDQQHFFNKEWMNTQKDKVQKDKQMRMKVLAEQKAQELKLKFEAEKAQNKASKLSPQDSKPETLQAEINLVN